MKICNSVEERNLGLMQEKLKQAADLLSDVYHYSCEEGIDFVERNMSCADGCIIESMQWLRDLQEDLEAQKIDDASWRA
jgi:hypothetical protein